MISLEYKRADTEREMWKRNFDEDIYKSGGNDDKE